MRVTDGFEHWQVVLECQVTWRYSAMPAEAYIYYGYGNDPYCHLQDDLGMATPAFGPLEFTRPK